MTDTIDLYLIRHGLAGESGSYPNDAERPLTDEGKKKTRQVAQRLFDLGLQFDLMLTSPLVRAKQTAGILMDVGLADRMEEASFLANEPIDLWLDWLKTWKPGSRQQLALVGHEPSLSEWAELLVWGEAKGAIALKKAGVIGITLPSRDRVIGHSTLFWLTPPRLLLP